jgi:serine/threonine-protein kinase
MSRNDESWGFAKGDPITPELTAMKLLGGGSAYEAYLAFDEITYAPVVVKVLRPSEVDDAHSLRGLRREVATLAAVNHPVVVRGLRHDVEGRRPHVVLEHIDGPRLSTLIRRHGRLAEQQYLPLAIELAAALHYFRHIDVCHLDIKPSNVIMGAPARLIDLSVGRSSGDATAIAAPIGTDFYMAPEQCDTDRCDGPGFASDVWGLGATLFEAVAGYRPFDEGDRDAEDPRLRFPQLVDPPYELPDGVPDEVAKVVYAALEPDPADRPLPHEIAGALEPVLAAQPPARLTFKVRR